MDGAQWERVLADWERVLRLRILAMQGRTQVADSRVMIRETWRTLNDHVLWRCLRSPTFGAPAHPDCHAAPPLLP